MSPCLTVLRVQDRQTNAQFALKVMAIRDAFDNVLFEREIGALNICQHPNVVTSLESWREEVIFSGVLTTCHMIVMELCETSLRQKLLDNVHVGFEIHSIKFITAQLIRGLDFVHSKGIMHRDLKPDNILLTSKGVVKIADFGMSRAVSPEHVYTPGVVTLWYRSPELLLMATNYSSAVDLWSLGCIVAEMFLGEPLLRGNSEISQITKIVELIGPVNRAVMPQYLHLPLLDVVELPQQHSPDVWARVGPVLSQDSEGLSLIASLLQINPDDRWPCADALSHPFVVNEVNEVDALLSGQESLSEHPQPPADQNNHGPPEVIIIEDSPELVDGNHPPELESSNDPPNVEDDGDISEDIAAEDSREPENDDERDEVHSLPWCGGLCAPFTQRAMLAGIELTSLVGSPMLDRSKGRGQTKHGPD
ncbi:cyclin-dependent kinase 9 [Plakobranchus ocellatus]|uniref:Cyclin-dependent kinase 9 n=1 Tax=Plakobranchus ocellatus TaxID=259542 RepID=A0AAV4AK34_9GAST|nr:cyclin-dependent kinase 9 [Plakobranchus ocellatus]